MPPLAAACIGLWGARCLPQHSSVRFMIRQTFIVVVGVLAAAASACAHGPVSEGQTERNALERRQASLLAALSDRSTERVVAHFAEDAVLHVGNMPEVQGRDAIRRFYGNVFRFLSSSTATIESVRISDGGDMAYSRGRVTNVFGAGERRSEFSGKFLLVWERRAGDWQLMIYSLSSDQPDPGR